MTRPQEMAPSCTWGGLDTRKKLFTGKIFMYWDRMHGKVMESPFLELFKRHAQHGIWGYELVMSTVILGFVVGPDDLRDHQDFSTLMIL